MPGLNREVDRLQALAAQRGDLITSRDKEIKDAKREIVDLTEQLGLLKKQLQQAEQNSGANTKDLQNELEKALAALAAEKIANDLLNEEQDSTRKRLERLMKDLALAKSSAGSSSSELEKLKMQVHSLERDNSHLHESIDEYVAMLKARDVEARESRLKIEQLLAQLKSQLSSAEKTYTPAAMDDSSGVSSGRYELHLTLIHI